MHTLRICLWFELTGSLLVKVKPVGPSKTQKKKACTWLKVDVRVAGFVSISKVSTMWMKLCIKGFISIEFPSMLHCSPEKKLSKQILQHLRPQTKATYLTLQAFFFNDTMNKTLSSKAMRSQKFMASLAGVLIAVFYVPWRVKGANS